MFRKITEYQKRLLEGVRKLVETEKFNEFIRMSLYFRKYSFGNLILIWTQCPNATRVAGIRTWNSLGRTVKKGEKGILIFAPVVKKVKKKTNEATDVDNAASEFHETTEHMEEDNPRLVGFKGVYVFDVSQTEGKPLPELEIGKTTVSDDCDIEDLYKRIRKASPIQVDYENITGSAKGYFSPREKRIVLSNSLSMPEKCVTLLHELAHYLLIDLGNFSRKHEELITEGAANIVSSYYGLDSSDYSVPYLASWSKGDLKEVLLIGERMRKVSEKLIKMIEAESLSDSRNDSEIIYESFPMEVNG